mmetsp:Transcript_6662/g.19500  ORF Transcript_6662/g.19500 Transcript_6662/m.19500 type:complete len:209 (-) Transcript_6662:212-838(-)
MHDGRPIASKFLLVRFFIFRKAAGNQTVRDDVFISVRIRPRSQVRLSGAAVKPHPMEGRNTPMAARPQFPALLLGTPFEPTHDMIHQRTQHDGHYEPTQIGPEETVCAPPTCQEWKDGIDEGARAMHHAVHIVANIFVNCDRGSLHELFDCFNEFLLLLQRFGGCLHVRQNAHDDDDDDDSDGDEDAIAVVFFCSAMVDDGMFCSVGG